MGLTSTEKARARRQRLGSGVRVVRNLYVGPDAVDALFDHALLRDAAATVTAEDIGVALELLLRALERRSVALDTSWLTVQAMQREPGTNGRWIAERLSERETLYGGWPSPFARPPSRTELSLQER